MIQTSQCNTNKQNLENKIEDVHEKIPDISGLTTAVLNTKIGKIEQKIFFPTSDYNKFTSGILDTKIKEK